MSTTNIKKPPIALKLLTAVGLVSFSVWGIAQIPPGWTISSNGGFLKSSNYSKLNNDQLQLCGNAYEQANNYKNAGAQQICRDIGGKWDPFDTANRCKKP